MMNLPFVRVSVGGRMYQVNYVLLHQNKQCSFRGYPNFIVHKDDIRAERILVTTGEIQSTYDPNTQNSI